MPLPEFLSSPKDRGSVEELDVVRFVARREIPTIGIEGRL